MSVQQPALREVPRSGATSIPAQSRRTSSRGADPVARSLQVAPQTWHRRSELDLVERQLRAITLFAADRRMREEAAVAAGSAAGASRELRMDLDRDVAVLRREQEALSAQTHDQLLLSAEPLRAQVACRVVLVHRHPWFLLELTRALEDGGAHVVARLDNGADAVGVVTAEQPDVVLVQDCLVMLAGEQVVREVRRFAPDALVAAQVEGSDRIGSFLDAGAAAVFTRQVPPAEVGLDLLRMAGPD